MIYRIQENVGGIPFTLFVSCVELFGERHRKACAGGVIEPGWLTNCMKWVGRRPRTSRQVQVLALRNYLEFAAAREFSLLK
jgi:hypothetical protein